MTPLQCISKCRRGMLTGRSACRPDLRTVTSDHRSVYDRWNAVLVLEGAASNATLRKYTWGLDLSGWAGTGVATVSNRWSVAPGVSPVEGIHGAGGIGGLLAAEEAATSGTPSYWFSYDANGNVGQAIKGSDRTVVAHYEYDPYGNTIAATGTYAATNPFRFSTKWFDAESGLYYYGYRYYSPWLGRWITRDSIEEAGGISLYRFVAAPTSEVDPHGQFRFIGDIWRWFSGSRSVCSCAAFMEDYDRYRDSCAKELAATRDTWEELAYREKYSCGGKQLAYLIYPDERRHYELCCILTKARLDGLDMEEFGEGYQNCAKAGGKLILAAINIVIPFP